MSDYLNTLASGYKAVADPFGWLGINKGKDKADVFKGGTANDYQSWQSDIGYDRLSDDEKKYADQYMGGIDFGSHKYDKNTQLAEWNSRLATQRSNNDYRNAKDTYGKLIDPNSDYNKGNFNRIERMNKPDSYQDSPLYNAMGFGSKSSSFLAQMALSEKQSKARESTYDQFSQSMERAQQSALGYLDLASGRNQSLLKIMNDQQLGIAQLKQQKELEDQQRKSQFQNSIIKTVIGGGVAMFNPVAGASIMGGGVMDYIEGSGRTYA